MVYIFSHTATVGVKGLIIHSSAAAAADMSLTALTDTSSVLVCAVVMTTTSSLLKLANGTFPSDVIVLCAGGAADDVTGAARSTGETNVESCS